MPALILNELHGHMNRELFLRAITASAIIANSLAFIFKSWGGEHFIDVSQYN